MHGQTDREAHLLHGLRVWGRARVRATATATARVRDRVRIRVRDREVRVRLRVSVEQVAHQEVLGLAAAHAAAAREPA